MTTADDYDPDAILADRNAHPIHKFYAAINIDARDNGTPWAKCPNCGDPFIDYQGQTLCSERCERQYLDYINNPEGF